MKKLTYLLALAMIFTLSSCGGSKEDKESKKEDVEAEEKKSDDKLADCDDFLKKYEEWMDAYVEVIEAVLTGKADEGIQEKYGTLIMEAGTWATNWLTMAACAADEKYQEKFEAIQQKATDKLEGIAGEVE